MDVLVWQEVVDGTLRLRAHSAVGFVNPAGNPQSLAPKAMHRVGVKPNLRHGAFSSEPLRMTPEAEEIAEARNLHNRLRQTAGSVRQLAGVSAGGASS